VAGEIRKVGIAAGVLDAVEAHARSVLPEECCGLLLGTAAGIVDAVRSANLSDDPARRFLLDPQAHFHARRIARDRGLAVVGFYHSHPDSEPVPSESDLAGATYEGHLYLIVRPLAAGCDGRLFRLEGSAFVPVEMASPG
jgi:desampylase